jgi:hypothetical protein
MLQAQTKQDIRSVFTLSLEIFETWEKSVKEANTDATLGEFFTCLKYTVSSLSSPNWQARTARSLTIDDNVIDIEESTAIDEVKAIIQDKVRLDAVTEFFNLDLLKTVAST